jgi:hypothetical protein
VKETWDEYRLRTGREYLEELLVEHSYNIRQATKSAGMNRTYFYRALATHGLKLSAFRPFRTRRLVDLNKFLGLN